MDNYNKILGIDYGSTRIGIALSDPLKIIATPYKAIKNDSDFIGEFKIILKNENVGLVVVGMPTNLKGVISHKAEEVLNFIDKLKSEIDIDIVTWDERFTTMMANKTILSMGVKKSSRQKKDGQVDSMAAAIMLQSYIDSKKNR